jgi:hypothetical protein
VGKSNRLVLFAISGLLAAILAARFFLNRQPIESPQELTELALRAGSASYQEQAATRLEALADRTPGTESRNPVQPFLVRLLNESDNPGVRAASMRALAAIWDYQCMPKMLSLLEDSSLQVRDTAAQSVAKLIDVRFDANASPEQRAKDAKRLVGMWETFQARTLKTWQLRLQEKDAKP